MTGDWQFGGPGGFQDQGAGLPPSLNPIAAPPNWFQDQGAGLPAGHNPAVFPPSYFQDQDAGLPLSQQRTVIPSNSYQDQDAGLPPSQHRTVIPPNSYQDQDAGLAPRSAPKSALSGTMTVPVAPPAQPRIGQPGYARQSARVQPIRAPKSTTPRATRASRQGRQASPLGPGSTRAGHGPHRIEGNRREPARRRLRRSKGFSLWLLASLISGIWALNVASTPGAGGSGSYGSSLEHVIAAGGPAQAISWWFLGSCFSLLIAASCFIANLLEET
jgi:hypothetical protein